MRQRGMAIQSSYSWSAQVVQIPSATQVQIKTHVLTGKPAKQHMYVEWATTLSATDKKTTHGDWRQSYRMQEPEKAPPSI
eukprot:3444564-Karenia_brevis.AAC.1